MCIDDLPQALELAKRHWSLMAIGVRIASSVYGAMTLGLATVELQAFKKTSRERDSSADDKQQTTSHCLGFTLNWIKRSCL
jgi:hypothetical protein